MALFNEFWMILLIISLKWTKLKGCQGLPVLGNFMSLGLPTLSTFMSQGLPALRTFMSQGQSAIGTFMSLGTFLSLGLPA